MRHCRLVKQNNYSKLFKRVKGAFEEIMTNRPTYRPTDQRTDRPRHREVQRIFFIYVEVTLPSEDVKMTEVVRRIRVN